ncbi:hypothetical protein [Tateyamaria omphalii]|uniref:Uncharacterized protein n=1 Tax=Tateyamaria omphalii TaxID=299262 RepID=A0A1P8MR64_9RHOB|nr:hypothetical protein [Tateyamaria omphalii]APX10541.1 hypothetical protein BWR18_01635 [Tateyamaria omphalii]
MGAALAISSGLADDPARVVDLVHRPVEKALPRVPPGSDMMARLFTILRNTPCSQMRSAERAGLGADGHGATTRTAPPAQEKRLACDDLLSAVRTRPADQRVALLLVCVAGYHDADAANMCDGPHDTVEGRVNHEHNKLAGLMDMDARHDILSNDRITMILQAHRRQSSDSRQFG